MVAENRVDAERRLENGKCFAPFLRHHRPGHKTVTAGKIAEQKNDIRRQIIG
jgi:hypothetical protein